MRRMNLVSERNHCTIECNWQEYNAKVPLPAVAGNVPSVELKGIVK